MPLLQATSASFTSVTSAALQYASNCAAASLLVSSTRTGSLITISSVADDTPQTWSQAFTNHDNAAGRQACYYFPNNANTGRPTVTWTYSGTNSPRVSIAEFSTVQTTTPLDQVPAVNTGTGTAETSSAATTTSANELLLGVFSAATDETWSQNGSWQIATSTVRNVLVYQEVTSTGTYTAAVDGSASIAWIGSLATFIETGGGGGGGAAPPNQRRLRGVG